MIGFQKDVRNLLARADIFALPSLDEGMPISLLEAVAAKVPAVTTAVGDIPKLIRHGESGVIVQPGNPARLAETLIALSQDPARRASLADAAYQRLKASYSSSHMYEMYDEVYRSVLTDSQPPGRDQVAVVAFQLVHRAVPRERLFCLGARRCAHASARSAILDQFAQYSRERFHVVEGNEYPVLGRNQLAVAANVSSHYRHSVRHVLENGVGQSSRSGAQHADVEPAEVTVDILDRAFEVDSRADAELFAPAPSARRAPDRHRAIADRTCCSGFSATMRAKACKSRSVDASPA